MSRFWKAPSEGKPLEFILFFFHFAFCCVERLENVLADLLRLSTNSKSCLEEYLKSTSRSSEIYGAYWRHWRIHWHYTTISAWTCGIGGSGQQFCRKLLTRNIIASFESWQRCSEWATRRNEAFTKRLILNFLLLLTTRDIYSITDQQIDWSPVRKQRIVGVWRAKLHVCSILTCTKSLEVPGSREECPASGTICKVISGQTFFKAYAVVA